MARTSVTHPLRISEVRLPQGDGLIGVTFCPGKQQFGALTGDWARDLGLDLAAIQRWRARLLVSLVTEAELDELKVASLGEAALELGLAWLHLPIDDYSVPTPDWERAWAAARGLAHQVLDDGGRLVVHCKGGLGRAGMVAARLLIERGEPPDAAIEKVRRARRGAIETTAQARYLAEQPIIGWRAN
jgi:hypothetical protein